VSSVFAVLQHTLDSGERELRLVDAQDAIASPACEFAVRRVR
jgi:pyridoxine kinase